MLIEDLPRRWLSNLQLKAFAVNTRINLLPNLWCICSELLNPLVLKSDDQHVTFSITENDKTFALSAIYAATAYLNRRKLWSSLNELQNQHNLPWCFIGDFNAILGAHEHRGRVVPARLPMEEFQNWTDDFNLIHLPTTGAEFTWVNGRRGARFAERRLDRAVCNQAWMDMCTSLNVSTLTRHKSDHVPLLLDFKLNLISVASQFKFLRMWSTHPECEGIIKDCWNVVFHGCPMYILSNKLKLVKQKLKIWNKGTFGNVHELVKNAENKLNFIHDQLSLNGPSDALLNDEKLAHADLESALNKQEIFWQEKANLNWHLHGDRNTKYFHRIAKIETASKMITSLQDGEQEPLLAEEVIPHLVTDEVNALMTLLPSHQEIKAAVFSLNKDSAPGPDGFGAFFFQNYWDIVKLDVFNAVLEFFTTSWILPGFNSNIIALLPKTSSATSIDQYRPIAMANFKFKIISKIIADRLANILPSLISEEQMGFIQDRNIKDCICIASEAVNLLHNKAFGDVLSRSIAKLVHDGKLDLIKGTRHINVPSHTFYADDLMVFCKGKLSGLMALKDLFDTYALQSGQRINTAKSTIYSGSITQGRLNLIINLLTFQIGSLPFNYLGIPIFRGKPKISWLQSTADKIHAKLSAWKASLLTMAGRVQLVRAVIQSMYTYNISIYSWPVSLIKKIEKDVKNFIWSGDVDKRKLVTVAWKKICRPLSQGGLNLRSLSCLNRSANLKLCWDLFHSHSSWAKLLLARIVRGKSVIRHHIYSSLWSSIKDEFSTLFDNSIWLLGDGKNISFWNDNWCGPALSEVFHIPDHISKRLVSSVPDFVMDSLEKNKFGIPCFRIC
ncbi:hypothetical protein QL285_090510 [Trifolium repens]|nr:hypothetical protein QL285_090510 [Trifolium repens]